MTEATKTPTYDREKIAADLGDSITVEIFEIVLTPEVCIPYDTSGKLRYVKDIKYDLFSLSDRELK